MTLPRFAFFQFAVVIASCLATTTGTAFAESVETVREKGPVKAIVRLTPAAPRIGDDLTLTLEVTAAEGVELILPSYGESLERFDVLGYLDRERLDDEGNTVATQEYTLQVPFSGKQSIPEILIEFVDRRPGKKPHPEDEDAYELLTERLDFEVQSVLPKDAAPELKPPLGELQKVLPPPPPRWPWFAGVAVVLLIAAPFVIKAVAHWRRLARRRSAYDIATASLAKLLKSPLPDTAEAIDPFFVELSGIVRRYLENRFELRAPELTTEEFLEAVSDSPDMTMDHQRLLRDFLKAADLVKFAHHMPTATDIEGSLNSVRRFLEETRENAPLIDEGNLAENSEDAAPKPPEVSHA